jgi:oligoendopeptidase F
MANCKFRVLITLVALLMPVLSMAQVKEAPSRNQIPVEYTWDLTAFFPSDSAWEVSFEKFQARIPEVTQYQSKLGESAENLTQCLMLTDTLSMMAQRLFIYTMLKFDEDSRVSNYQEMRDRANRLYSQINQATSFEEPEILKIPEEKLRSFIDSNNELAIYRFYLEDTIRRKAHIRSEEVENILAQAFPVTAGPGRIFSMLDNADIKFPNIKDENGAEIELTRGRFSQILESPDRDLRRRASEAYNDTYKKYINTLSATLSASVNGDIFYTKVRGYNTCLERALDSDSIPESVFYNLIQAVNNNLEPLHKYIALRKKALAVDTLFGYDLSVPIVPESKMEFTYGQAEDYLFKGLKPLGNEYLGNVRQALNSRWIDVYETQGKRSGAYTSGAYAAHPVMLLNFAGTLNDVFTLAHEMGHMMHNYYTYQNEPFAYSWHSVFTAEVASTCNEAIMIKYMFDHTRDRNEKLYLLNYYIDQIINTFYTQVWFSEYELKIHETVEKGGALSAESLRKFYREIFEKYYGPDLYVPPDRDLGGMRIPHFYRMYYVYQYATSYAASQMLSQKIIQGDKAAKAAYMNFIKTGTSDYPIDILKKAGVDMTTTEPFDNTIRVFSDLVDQFEKLLAEK